MSTVSRTLSQITETGPRRQEIVSRIREYWYAWLIIVATAIQLVSLRRVLHPLTSNSYPPLKDSVIFEYIGWYITQGGRLYIDVWEIKPPLSFETTALFALMSGGNMRLYHTLVLAVTNAAVVGCAVTVGLVTYELTDDEMASFTSGLALFALPAFHWRAAFGFKPKYFVVLFGLLAVYLALRDHSFLAGVAGAASVGYWQLGVIFPLLALGILHQRSRRQGVIWMFVGGGIVTTVMLAPIVWWGAVDEMFVETVLTPLVVSNDAQPVLAQLRFAVRLFGRTLPLVLLGTIGVFLGVRRAPRTRWWLLPGALWFAVQIAILDLDAYPDLIPGFAFVALGLGLVLGDPPHRQHAVHGLVVVMVIISVVTLGPLQVAAPTHPPEATAVNAPYWGEERPALLWRTIPTETCRPFFGATEAKIVNHVGGSLHDRVCGDFTSMWTAFRQQYLDPI